MQSDRDIIAIEKLKNTGIPMTLTVYDGQIEKQMMLGYEIDNSFLKTKDPFEIIPLVKKIKIIEVKFYLNNHIGWFYDSVFLFRHTMTEDMDIYIKK